RHRRPTARRRRAAACPRRSDGYPGGEGVAAKPGRSAVRLAAIRLDALAGRQAGVISGDALWRKLGKVAVDVVDLREPRSRLSPEPDDDLLGHNMGEGKRGHVVVDRTIRAGRAPQNPVGA